MNNTNFKIFVKICFTLILISGNFLVFAQEQNTKLTLDTGELHELKLQDINGEYQIQTLGKNPYLFTLPLTSERKKENVALSFEYFCPKGLDFFKIHFGKNATVKTIKSIGVAEGWVTFSIDLTDDLKNWGKTGDQLRFDFGSRADVEIQIRNIVIRKPTEREQEIAAKREEKQKAEATMEVNLKNYLSKSYMAQISKVNVAENELTITGNTPNVSQVFLAEITPYQDVTELKSFKNLIPIKQKTFFFKIKRFNKKEGFNYDRVLSKWVLVKKTTKGFQLLSHAHYPDEIYAKNNLTKEVANGKKGLGGFSVNRGHLSDLDDLNITSATVNIWFSRFMYSQPAANRIAHVYNGKTYYFDEKAVAGFDETFSATAAKGIVTAAILLVDKIEKSADPVIGKLLQHPDMDPAGIYSMPNMTNPASVNCYAAALDFFASRYSRPDKKYGRCNHWIMHNEVDAGWVWTNMGNKSASVFMDAYVKSMRMCYAIARQYNPYSEVFVSLTHFWALKSSPQFYPSKDLMEILLQYTKDEGDFEWAMAQHPYPQDLREPKTWNDKQVDFTFNTPLITFKNIEVLDAWIKKPEVLYKGKIKRTLWLSENGTNSRTYSQQDLAEQAAGFAYAWKKIEVLNGIDGFQWHNWIDNRAEGGLRIGLRRFPDDEENPGGTKPVWEVYKAADTKNENVVFDQYKDIIGIKSWDEVQYKAAIKQ
jgi:hypothetical protein